MDPDSEQNAHSELESELRSSVVLRPQREQANVVLSEDRISTSQDRIFTIGGLEQTYIRGLVVFFFNLNIVCVALFY